MVHRVQHLTAQIVAAQASGGSEEWSFRPAPRLPKVNSCEAAKHRRLIEGFFHARIRQAEPLLQKVSPKHDRDSHRVGDRCPPWGNEARPMPAIRSTERPAPYGPETVPACSSAHASRNSSGMPVSAESAPFASCFQFMQIRRGSQTCAEVP